VFVVSFLSHQLSVFLLELAKIELDHNPARAQLSSSIAQHSPMKTPGNAQAANKNANHRYGRTSRPDQGCSINAWNTSHELIEPAQVKVLRGIELLLIKPLEHP